MTTACWAWCVLRASGLLFLIRLSLSLSHTHTLSLTLSFAQSRAGPAEMRHDTREERCPSSSFTILPSSKIHTITFPSPPPLIICPPVPAHRSSPAQPL